MQIRTYRKIHRWLGIIIGVQLVLWTGSGLFFALNPIEKVRGETEKARPAQLPADLEVVSPVAALAELRGAHGEIEISSVLLRPHLGTAVYEVSFLQQGMRRWALVDAASGRLRGPVDGDEAIALARSDFTLPAEVKSVTKLSSTDEDSEYRGGPLPVYRIAFDHPLGTRIYVSADRGVVTARRNDRWRAFDFLWMFHIMDYRARDDFNTLVLQITSALGLVTVLSGFVLAALTSPLLRGWFGSRKGADRL